MASLAYTTHNGLLGTYVSLVQQYHLGGVRAYRISDAEICDRVKYCCECKCETDIHCIRLKYLPSPCSSCPLGATSAVQYIQSKVCKNGLLEKRSVKMT